MRRDLKLTDIRLLPAGIADQAAGLLGFVEATANGTLRLSGITLRRTAEGRLALSYPARLDRRGGRHFYLRPRDDTARRDVERLVFQALGLPDSERRP